MEWFPLLINQKKKNILLYLANKDGKLCSDYRNFGYIYARIYFFTDTIYTAADLIFILP
jgi:hypothetical protein